LKKKSVKIEISLQDGIFLLDIFHWSSWYQLLFKPKGGCNNIDQSIVISSQHAKQIKQFIIYIASPS
jgi:hypothetical protein